MPPFTGIQNPFGKLQYGALKPVTKSCYIFRNVVNSALIVTADGLVVVDTQITAMMATRFLRAIRALTPAPIRYVINTHYHWDHWAGNDVFKAAGATLISGALTREFMQRRSIRQRAFLRSRGFAIPDQDPALPEETFEHERVLRLGGLPIHLMFLGRAETDDPTAVYLPTEDCVVSGDTLMTGSFPILGQPVMAEGMGEDRAWMATLRKMRALNPKVIIPGHGPLGGVQDIDFFIELQAYFLDRVQPLVEEGRSVDEIIRIVETGLPEAYATLPQVWGTARYAVLRAIRSMTGWQQMKPSAIPRPDPEALTGALRDLVRQPDAFIQAAASCEGQNRLDLALGIIEEGCREFSKEPALWVERGRLHLKASRMAGSVLERADFFIEVCRSAEQALMIAPDHGPALILLGSYHAMGAYRNGDDPAAPMTLLKKALTTPLSDADQAKAQFFLGICYRSLEQEDEAMAQFKKARELDPTYLPAVMAMEGIEGTVRTPDRMAAARPK